MDIIQLDLIQNIDKVKNQNKINPRSFYLPNVKKNSEINQKIFTSVSRSLLLLLSKTL